MLVKGFHFVLTVLDGVIESKSVVGAACLLFGSVAGGLLSGGLLAAIGAGCLLLMGRYWLGKKNKALASAPLHEREPFLATMVSGFFAGAGAGAAAGAFFGPLAMPVSCLAGAMAGAVVGGLLNGMESGLHALVHTLEQRKKKRPDSSLPTESKMPVPAGPSVAMGRGKDESGQKKTTVVFSHFFLNPSHRLPQRRKGLKKQSGTNVNSSLNPPTKRSEPWHY